MILPLRGMRITQICDRATIAFHMIWKKISKTHVSQLFPVLDTLKGFAIRILISEKALTYMEMEKRTITIAAN